MKYIIMCGGNYKDQFETPKPLLEVNGEILVERTIRLLIENGITDIAISTNNPDYEYLDIQILKHNNEYIHDARSELKKSKNCWLNAYYPSKEPACYLAGDIYWSDEAIRTIIQTEVKNTMFFCTRDLCDGKEPGINIKGREPLAYKVQNQKVFRQAINDLLQMIDDGKFTADPIAWNLYRQLNNIQLDYNGFGNGIFNTKGDYCIIEDYTTDIDSARDIPKLEQLIKIKKGGIKMIKVEALEDFYLGRYNELQNIQRKAVKENGKLFKGDVFECTEEMTEYLIGKNALNKAFVKVVEVIPEKPIEEPKIETKEEVKPAEEKKVIRTRKTNKKTIAKEK